MLENKIKELSKKIILVAGIALNLSCDPSLIVPTKVLGSDGYVETGIDCCTKIDCRKYDGCKSEGEKYNPQTGIYEESCGCYSKYTPPPYEPGGSGKQDAVNPNDHY